MNNWKDEYTIESVKKYLSRRCSETLRELVIVADGHYSSNPRMKGLKGMTLIAIDKNDLLKNESAILAVFAPHEGMTKTRDRLARRVRNDLQCAGIDAKYLYIDKAYSDLPKGKNQTRSDAIEKIACEWLGYDWSGGMNHSALYDHETNARLGRKGGRAVADGYSEAGALEVKCKRGRTTYLNDALE